MAPREQKVHGSAVGGLDYHHPPKVFDTTTAPSTKSTISRQHYENQQHHGERIIFFKIGPLRFGLHGVSGMLGIIFVSYALYLSYNTSSKNDLHEHTTNHLIPLWLAVAIVATTLQCSVGSYGLLNQVPKSSKIASWIIPPHREAFKRTIAIAVYLNIRLVHLWICYQHLLQARNVDSNNMNSNIGKDVNENLLFPIGLFLYTNYNFFPINFDYSNGNSFVFVLPMFIGLNIDTLQQFPKFTLTTAGATSIVEWITNCTSLAYAKTETDDYGYNSSLTCSLSSFLSHLNWDHAHEWNTTKVNEMYLLITLLCTLQIAFMFTIAFRGRMNIKFCYWIAALEVGLLSVRLVRG